MMTSHNVAHGDVMSTTPDFTDDSTTPSFQHSVPVSVRATVVVMVTTFIIISNLMNLYCLRKVKELPRNSRMFLLNLSVADLCVGITTCLPATYSSFHDSWPYGDVYCQISGVGHGMSVTVSIWSLASVSLDRYIAINHPLRYTSIVTDNRVRLFLLGLWLGAFASFVAPIIVWPPFYYKYSAAENYCGMYWANHVSYCLLTGLYTPILSGTVILFTTCRIGRIAKRQAQRIQANDVIVQNGANGGRNVSRRDNRAVRVLVVTSLMYFTAWGPYVGVAYAGVWGVHVPDNLAFFTSWLANSNSFWNVIIYCVVNSAFRRQARLLVKKFVTFQWAKDDDDSIEQNSVSLSVNA